jgi:hypothetical protein
MAVIYQVERKQGKYKRTDNISFHPHSTTHTLSSVNQDTELKRFFFLQENSEG